MGFGDLGDGGGAVLLVLFWVALIVVIVWALTRLFPRDGRSASPASPASPVVPARGGDSPLGILDRRLASGEIDVDTYARVRSALEGVVVAPPAEPLGGERWEPDVSDGPEPGGLAVRREEPSVVASEAATLIETMGPGELHA